MGNDKNRAAFQRKTDSFGTVFCGYDTLTSGVPLLCSLSSLHASRIDRTTGESGRGNLAGDGQGALVVNHGGCAAQTRAETHVLQRDTCATRLGRTLPCFSSALGFSSVATLATLKQPTPSLRVNPANRNHHLWNNNGVWWIHLTMHLPGYTKRRVRRSMKTADVRIARRRRDLYLRNCGSSFPSPATRSAAAMFRN